jgi:glycyl-tRNA synthetase beta chain
MKVAELFIEIRCEELPARFVGPAQAALGRATEKLLQGVDTGAVRTWATPRRLAVAVADVLTERPVEEKLITGPSEAAAFRDGAPTPAAQGFARSKGINVADLEIVDGPRGRVIAARVRTGGEQTADLIAAGLEAMILGIPFPKSMQWGAGGIQWGRPIHGVVAMLDGALIPTTVAGIATGNTTLGHRLTPGPISVTGAADWVDQLRMQNVEPDGEIRRASIETQLAERAQALGTETPDMPDLVAEVANLTECPVVIDAQFEAELLALPPRLLVETMKVHQRVFPLFKDGALVNQFLVVTNHPYATDDAVAAVISKGNTKVLAARFHDAQFFYAEDRKNDLAAHGERLSGMRWIRDGGTMADKAQRLGALAQSLSDLVGADPDTARTVGSLSKADLTTQMVGEFPKLQGHVGRLLAQLQGQGDEVCLGIEEHYLPRYSGDALPTTPSGRAAALADRIDTLTGCFSLGLKPKGSADPLGLRRAANGLLIILRDAKIATGLDALWSQSGFSPPNGSGWADLQTFVMARLRAQLQERFATDLVDAVLATGDTDPVALEARAEAMHTLSHTAEFGPIKNTFKRVMGLTKDHESTDYDPAGLVDAAATALHQSLQAVSDQAAGLADALDFSGSLAQLSSLKAPVDTFFDAVLVMHEDETIRRNRLGLLRNVADQFRRIADFTHLSSD